MATRDPTSTSPTRAELCVRQGFLSLILYNTFPQVDAAEAESLFA